MAGRAPIFVATMALVGCAAENVAPTEPQGKPAVAFLADDLMRIELNVSQPVDPVQIRQLTDCAAAEALAEKGIGFARHVRTTFAEEAGISRADAVYTISPTLPAGDFVIAASEVSAVCRADGTTGV